MKKIVLLLLLAFCFTNSKAQILNPAFCQTNSGGSVYCVAVDSVNNVLYVGGNFTSMCGSPRNKLAAMNLTTGAILPWNPGANNVPNTMYVYNNALYVGGYFTTIGGQAHNYVAKFYLPSRTLSTWAPNITSGTVVNSIVARGDKVYLGGNFLLTISTGKNLCELDTGTAAPTTWPAATTDAAVQSLSISGTDLYVAGSYTTIASASQNYIAKITIPSGALNAWDPIVDGPVYAVLAKGSNIFMAGNFTFLNIDSRSNIGCVDATTATATSWNPGCNGQPTKLIYRNGMIYAVSNNYSVLGGKSRFFIGAIDINTGWVSNWDLQPGSSLYDAATTPSQIYVGGAMSTVLGGTTRLGLAVVCINPIDSLLPTISGSTTVCNGLSGVSYSVAPVKGATSYVWSYSGTGVTILGTSNAVTANFSSTATSGNITVQAINNCESSNTQTLTINTYSFTATAVPNSSSLVCGDSTDITSSDNYLGGGSITYSWAPATGLNATNVYKVTSGVHATTNYTVTETSTEGCVAKDIVTITVSPITINLSSGTTNILCGTSDSLFAINNYNGVGVVTYTWAPSASLNLSNPSKPLASPVVTTDYTVSASATSGCLATPQTITVIVDPFLLSTGIGSNTITCGNSMNLNVMNTYPGSGTVTYTWSPSADLNNANSATPVASPTATTNYTVDASSTEGCLATSNEMVYVDPLQVFTVGAISTTCSNPVTLTTTNNSGNVGLVYLWTPAGGLSNSTVASPSANVGMTTTFTVTMSLPSTGCASASAVDTVKIVAPATPAICMATDSASLYNVIYWDKTSYLPTDSFVVYREVTTNTYVQIGIVSHDSLSEFVDTAQSIGPANGNPNIGTYRYKIAVKDSCGNISQKSPYHNTIYFIDNHTGVFTWNVYTVESMTVTPVTQFNLERDNLNNGIWTLVGSVAGTQTTLNDPQYATYQAVANWRVEALGFSCTPTMRGSNGTQAAIIRSKSNITNNRGIGIKTNNASSTIEVYPNPTNGTLIVSLGTVSNSKTMIKIISMLGEEIYNELVNAVNDKYTIDLSKFQNGTYVVQITTDNYTVTKRIIKN